MYTHSSPWYDAIYHFKDYAAETATLLSLIRSRCPAAATLLDVACGTGRHLEYLGEHFQVEGLDLNPVLLDRARQRCAGTPLHQGDMTRFDLQRRFDVVTCLFSAIGYLEDSAALTDAITVMAHHLTPDGLLIVEPWFRPEDWRPGTVHANYVNEPELKIARISDSGLIGNRSIMDIHYLVGRPGQIEHFTERHEMTLFTDQEYRAGFREAGLTVDYDPEGLIGRGLYIGTPQPGN